MWTRVRVGKVPGGTEMNITSKILPSRGGVEGSSSRVRAHPKASMP